MNIMTRIIYIIFKFVETALLTGSAISFNIGVNMQAPRIWALNDRLKPSPLKDVLWWTGFSTFVWFIAILLIIYLLGRDPDTLANMLLSIMFGTFSFVAAVLLLDFYCDEYYSEVDEIYVRNGMIHGYAIITIAFLKSIIFFADGISVYIISRRNKGHK